MKYVKRPIVVEARQVTADNFNEVIKWASLETTTQGVVASGGTLCKTMDGNDRVIGIGDYIIKGSNGKFYSFDAEDFESIYELSPQEYRGKRWHRHHHSEHLLVPVHPDLHRGTLGPTFCMKKTALICVVAAVVLILFLFAPLLL